MSFFSGTPFFVLLTGIVLTALVIGCMERSLRWLDLLASVGVVVVILSKTPEALIYFVIYFALELLLVQLYARIRQIHGRSAWRYRLFVLLSILPLVLCKLCETKPLAEMNWFGFTGISYLTFRVVQIIIEMYDGVITEVGVLDFAGFLLFFPTFSCGPIDRSRRFTEDFHKVYQRAEYLELFGRGLEKFMLGLAYKMVLADLFYKLLQKLTLPTVPMMAGYAYVYGFYMFFDFAGYSLMAIGTGYMLGICVPENFNRPFLATDMKDFWARWHISLSEWFRDFVFSRFVMLSMKHKWFKTRLSGASVGFLVNMLVMGFWHGLTWHYIFYGLYHGVLLAGTEIYQKKSKFYKRNKKKRWYRIASWAVTINLVMLGFLIFSGHLIAV